MSLEAVGRGDRIPLDRIEIKRRHRTLEERIFVRFPALAQRAGDLVFRLPRGSAPRRRMIARRASQAASAANRRDFDVLLLGFDEEIDYEVISAGPGGSIAPDLAGRHHGHSGYRHVWRVWLEGVPDLTLEPEGLVDLGEHLVSATRLRGHGAGSGAPIDQLQYQVFTFRRGLVVKQRDYAELDQALESVNV